VTRTLTLAAGLVPVLVLGGHIDALAVPSAVAAVAAPALLILLLFRYAGRPWATDLESRTDPRIVPTGPVRCPNLWQ